MNKSLIKGLSTYESENATKICIGTFDGYHCGHQQLTKNSDYIVTFFPHPKSIILKNKTIEILTFPEELDYFYSNRITIPFNTEIQSMSAIEFLNTIIGKILQPSQITIGYDFKFGVNQTGGIKLLREWGDVNNCTIVEIPKQLHSDNTPYKSSIIRKEIKTNPNFAFELLGHEYPIYGSIIKGNNRGQKIGFPTANLQPLPTKCVPKNGVYSSTIIIDNISYPSITNIGNNPTYGTQTTSIETHILNNFDQDIYNKKALLLLKYFIRDEMKFNSEKELITQIKQDITHPSMKSH